MKRLNKKQRRTLNEIYSDPLRSDVKWNDIENLLTVLGAELSEGKGSRIRIYLNDTRAVFHRPHSKSETDKGALKSMRKFLTAAGVKDVEI